MEDFVLTALAEELKPQLVGYSLEAVHQIGMTEFIFSVARGAGRVTRLLVSLDQSGPRIYRVGADWRSDSPPQETSFSARLMNALADHEVVSLEKLPFDRVLKISWVNPFQRELGASSLYIELISQGPNVFLVDCAGIVQEAFHSDFDRKRALTLNALYGHRPQPLKLDPRACTEMEFYEAMGDMGRPCAVWLKALTTAFLGVSPTLAKEAVFRAGEDRRLLFRSFREVIVEGYEQSPHPCLFVAPGLTEDLGEERLSSRNMLVSTIAVRHLSAWRADPFPTVNDAVRVYYERLAEERAYRALRLQLLPPLSRQRAKLERLLAHFTASRADFNASEILRIKGELLLANLHRLRSQWHIDPRGEPLTITLENYYETPPSAVEVTVDPKVSLQANADRYFKQYRKAKRGWQILEKKIPATHSQLKRLSEAAEAIGKAKTLPALQAVAATCRWEKPIRRQRIEIRKSKRKVEEIAVRRFVTSDTLEVLVGHTARENDELTFRVAAPHDVWMHTADYPGSHVVIRNPKKSSVPERSIREAAQIAAYYSQARNNGKVTVHHTLRKFVHKPRHAAHGLVTLSQFKSITVAPKKTITPAEPT
ncbi:MAG: NFACT family protein [Acidobacteria bacterium]|nr:NFACT family protein [Acidobacteriota bacterium]